MTEQQINDMFTALADELSSETLEQFGWWKTRLWALVDNVAEHIKTFDIMAKRETGLNTEKAWEDAKKLKSFIAKIPIFVTDDVPKGTVLIVKEMSEQEAIVDALESRLEKEKTPIHGEH